MYDQAVSRRSPRGRRQGVGTLVDHIGPAILGCLVIVLVVMFVALGGCKGGTP
jgi:hypothetical protein